MLKLLLISHTVKEHLFPPQFFYGIIHKNQCRFQMAPSFFLCAPTSLPIDLRTLPRYLAHVGGVVRQCLREAAQRHPVAGGLQLLHVASVFELDLRRRAGHVGVNQKLFGPGGPGELVAVDLIGLGRDQTVDSQVVVVFNAHGYQIALGWRRQQH